MSSKTWVGTLGAVEVRTILAGNINKERWWARQNCPGVRGSWGG